MNAFRWILCLPAAVAAYLVVCVVYVLLHGILALVGFPSSREWIDVISSHDMNDDYLNGTFWIFIVKYIASFLAVLSAALCAPSHRAVVAAVVGTMGPVALVMIAIWAAFTPGLEHTFSHWYRTVLEIAAAIAGSATAVVQIAKMERTDCA